MVTPYASDKLLKTIFCSCKTGCGSQCGYRRAGIICNLANIAWGILKVCETEEEIESESEADTLLGSSLLIRRNEKYVNDVINEVFQENKIENLEEDRNDEVQEE